MDTCDLHCHFHPWKQGGSNNPVSPAIGKTIASVCVSARAVHDSNFRRAF